MNHRSTHYICKKTFLFKSAKKAKEKELLADPGYDRRGWGANLKEGEKNLLIGKMFAENSMKMKEYWTHSFLVPLPGSANGNNRCTFINMFKKFKKRVILKNWQRGGFWFNSVKSYCFHSGTSHSKQFLTHPPFGGGGGLLHPIEFSRKNNSAKIISSVDGTWDPRTLGPLVCALPCLPGSANLESVNGGIYISLLFARNWPLFYLKSIEHDCKDLKVSVFTFFTDLFSLPYVSLCGQHLSFP